MYNTVFFHFNVNYMRYKIIPCVHFMEETTYGGNANVKVIEWVEQLRQCVENEKEQSLRQHSAISFVWQWHCFGYSLLYFPHIGPSRLQWFCVPCLCSWHLWGDGLFSLPCSEPGCYSGSFCALLYSSRAVGQGYNTKIGEPNIIYHLPAPYSLPNPYNPPNPPSLSPGFVWMSPQNTGIHLNAYCAVSVQHAALTTQWFGWH